MTADATPAASAPALLLGVGRFCSRTMVRDPGWHRHRWHELVLVTDGRYEVACEGGAMRGGPGSVFHYHAGRAHLPRPIGDEPVALVFLQYAQEGDAPLRRPLQSHDADGRVLALLRRMEDLFPGIGARAEPRRAQALASLLDLVLFEHEVAEGRDGDRLVRTVRAFVSDRLDRPIALADLARAADLSRFHFARSFQAAAGVPPLAFVRRLRLEAAIELLRRTDAPHKAVARAIGLRGEAALRRLFRRELGRTPGAVRRGL